MRPEKIYAWREQLPPPFDRIRPKINRRGSFVHLGFGAELEAASAQQGRRRSRSTTGALDQSDRKLSWLRHGRATRARKQSEHRDQAIRKLERLRDVNSSNASSYSSSARTLTGLKRARHKATWTRMPLEQPSLDEMQALAEECFPPIEKAKVIITEYSERALRTSEYTLEEVLVSDCILQPGDFTARIRWIYVEYYKTGTFWGSDYRFAQWGTDPAIFEKSPIALLQARLAELDRTAARPPLEDEDLPGYKRIGKYYREVPGCPEYLGLRVDSSAWLRSDNNDLLLEHLRRDPNLSRTLQQSSENDLAYALAYINAVECIRESTYTMRPGLRDIHRIANDEDVYAYGSWDDTVERLEFYREHTLLSCGSPRLYNNVAARLRRDDDVLRRNPDCALLYYTLARVSIENDEMMQDGPERALNKVFARLKGTRSTERDHVERVFSLQQAVSDGLEYLEENKRELPMWGIPPFDTHQVQFHLDHAPPPVIRELIQKEMDLVDRDFSKIISHWRLLRDKVDRYLDILLQFRVLDQQELAVTQSHLATQQQSLAAEEARNTRVQARSVIIFTAITIVFLPLSFFTSYFGMNVTDVAHTVHSSAYFWLIAGPTSALIILATFGVTTYYSAPKQQVVAEEKALGRSGGRMARVRAPWETWFGGSRGKMKYN